MRIPITSMGFGSGPLPGGGHVFLGLREEEKTQSKASPAFSSELACATCHFHEHQAPNSQPVRRRIINSHGFHSLCDCLISDGVPTAMTVNPGERGSKVPRQGYPVTTLALLFGGPL